MTLNVNSVRSFVYVFTLVFTESIYHALTNK